MKFTLIILALFVLGCASVNADRPVDSGPSAHDLNHDLLDMIAEQAFMIEALQGEIMALQEGGGDYGYVYYVQPGQSLWGIADEVMGDPYKWMTIYSMNCGFLGGSPDLIYPNQVLLLP